MTYEPKIEYLPAAQEDLDGIFDYIAKDNPEAAENFIDQIDEAISMRLDHLPK